MIARTTAYYATALVLFDMKLAAGHLRDPIHTMSLFGRLLKIKTFFSFQSRPTNVGPMQPEADALYINLRFTYLFTYYLE